MFWKTILTLYNFKHHQTLSESILHNKTRQSAILHRAIADSRSPLFLTSFGNTDMESLFSFHIKISQWNVLSYDNKPLSCWQFLDNEMYRVKLHAHTHKCSSLTAWHGSHILITWQSLSTLQNLERWWFGLALCPMNTAGFAAHVGAEAAVVERRLIVCAGGWVRKVKQW